MRTIPSMRTDIDITHFKEKLLDEKKILEGELSHLGRINPENKNDWEATPGDLSDIQTARADENELADEFEDFEERNATQNQLENRLLEVNAALTRIEDGTYGICEISKEPIEKERLEANPAARTTIAHRSDL